MKDNIGDKHQSPFI